MTAAVMPRELGVANDASHAHHGLVGLPGRPRGNFWEVTFLADVPPVQDWQLTATALATETGKTQVQITTFPPTEAGRVDARSTTFHPTRAVNLSKKTFDGCDINHFDLKDSSFRGCTFTNCRFIKANFEGVKFSGCRFEQCHFLNVRFVRSQFIGCTFSRISASAEQMVFSETSLSAEAFVGALLTNLSALPSGTSAAVQSHRFLADKAKIARAIFLSVRDQPELDQLFDATRCFEVALQQQQIADATSLVEGATLRRQGLWSRCVTRPARVLALWLILAAGFLTNWGRSPAKSAWLLAFAVALFTVVYWWFFKQDADVAFLRALDCTFVFGYTRYAGSPDKVGALDFVAFGNALIGFCWYALLVPALSKRLFR